MNLLLFVLAVWGMTQILVYGEIFDKIRPEHKFFHCTMCIGFHVGWFLYLLFWLFDVLLFPNVYAGMFVFGCIGSATSYALCSVFDGNGISISKGDE
jgi:hypothetical protein